MDKHLGYFKRLEINKTSFLLSVPKLREVIYSLSRINWQAGQASCLRDPRTKIMET